MNKASKKFDGLPITVVTELVEYDVDNGVGQQEIGKND